MFVCCGDEYFVGQVVDCYVIVGVDGCVFGVGGVWDFELLFEGFVCQLSWCDVCWCDRLDWCFVEGVVQCWVVVGCDELLVGGYGVVYIMVECVGECCGQVGLGCVVVWYDFVGQFVFNCVELVWFVGVCGGIDGSVVWVLGVFVVLEVGYVDWCDVDGVLCGVDILEVGGWFQMYDGVVCFLVEEGFMFGGCVG